MNINKTLVSKEVVDKIRRFIPSVPDKLTIRKGIKYMLSAKALKGDQTAIRELLKDEPKKEGKKGLEEFTKELLKIGEI